jgi:hypothetical protein
VTILPGSELVHHEEEAVVPPELGDLVVKVRKPLLELAPQSPLGQARADQFLAELLEAVLCSEIFRAALVLALEVADDPGFFVLGGLLGVPVRRQFGGRHLNLIAQLRSQRLNALANLFLEHPHQAVFALGRAHTSQGESDREQFHLGQRASVLAPEFVVTDSVPDSLLGPEQEVEQRPEEMCLPSTVLRLDPETLAFPVDCALEDSLEVLAQRCRDAVVGHGGTGLARLDDLRQARSGLRLWLEGDDFAQFPLDHRRLPLSVDLFHHVRRPEVLHQPVRDADNIVGFNAGRRKAAKDENHHREVTAVPLEEVPRPDLVTGEQTDGADQKHRPVRWPCCQALEMGTQLSLKLRGCLLVVHRQAVWIEQVKQVQLCHLRGPQCSPEVCL